MISLRWAVAGRDISFDRLLEVTRKLVAGDSEHNDPSDADIVISDGVYVVIDSAKCYEGLHIVGQRW